MQISTKSCFGVAAPLAIGLIGGLVLLAGSAALAADKDSAAATGDQRDAVAASAGSESEKGKAAHDFPSPTVDGPVLAPTGAAIGNKVDPTTETVPAALDAEEKNAAPAVLPAASDAKGSAAAADATTPPNNAADLGGQQAGSAATALDNKSRLPAELSPQLKALRDRIRRTLATYHSQPLGTQENTVADAIAQVIAFGCYTQIMRDGKPVNGVTNLCWNNSCGGFEPLMICDDHITARVGYGLQQRPGQMLAAFAIARVPIDYPVRVGSTVRTVGDMVEFEKLHCRNDDDLALKLLALAFYADDANWKSADGEEWNVEKLVAEVLEQPVVGAPEGGTTQLLALAKTLELWNERERPITGEFARAQQFLTRFHGFALGLQNDDGSWGPDYFATRAGNRDRLESLQPTGRILGWFATSLPDEELTNPQVVRAVEYVTNTLGQYSRNSTQGMSAANIAGIMHSLRALAVYDARLFKPFDAPPKEVPANDKPAGK